MIYLQSILKDKTLKNFIDFFEFQFIKLVTWAMWCSI